MFETPKFMLFAPTSGLLTPNVLFETRILKQRKVDLTTGEPKMLSAYKVIRQKMFMHNRRKTSVLQKDFFKTYKIPWLDGNYSGYS